VIAAQSAEPDATIYKMFDRAAHGRRFFFARVLVA
jgi:hypothetical protein